MHFLRLVIQIRCTQLFLPQFSCFSVLAANRHFCFLSFFSSGVFFYLEARTMAVQIVPSFQLKFYCTTNILLYLTLLDFVSHKNIYQNPLSFFQ